MHSLFCLVKDMDVVARSLQVEDCYTLSATYNSSNNPEDLKKLENVIDSLGPADSIVVASAFSHMLTLGNVAGDTRLHFTTLYKIVFALQLRTYHDNGRLKTTCIPSWFVSRTVIDHLYTASQRPSLYRKHTLLYPHFFSWLDRGDSDGCSTAVVSKEGWPG